MQISYKQIALPFQHPFTISGGRTKTHQPSLIVQLQIGPYIGIGEAPAISYYNITVEEMIADIEAKRKMLEKFAFTEPARWWHFLHHLYPKNPFLVCALDMAGWDLYGKMKGLPLYKIWNTEWRQFPITDYTIGIDTIDIMVEKMKNFPHPIYKIKMGMENDIEMIAALRQQTDAIFRVDANAGWTVDEAKTKIEALTKYNVELVEQPLAKDDWDGMKTIFNWSPIPVIADESCVFEHDVEKCVHHFHGINIKLTKCSGITPALRMIEKAKQLNLKIMMGSMNECTVGASANANFIPQLDFLDMDGPLLLAEDAAIGLQFNNGIVSIEGKTGLGIKLKELF